MRRADCVAINIDNRYSSTPHWSSCAAGKERKPRLHHLVPFWGLSKPEVVLAFGIKKLTLQKTLSASGWPNVNTKFAEFGKFFSFVCEKQLFKLNPLLSLMTLLHLLSSFSSLPARGNYLILRRDVKKCEEKFLCEKGNYFVEWNRDFLKLIL